MLHWLQRLLPRRTELDASEAYERWAPCYPPRAHNRLMELEERAVLDMLPNPQGCAVLDLGCGSGRYLNLVLRLGASPVVGVDASHAMLTRARTISPGLIQADLLALSLRPSTFQIVICALAVGHVEDLSRAMREIGRVLVPGGTVVYSDLHPCGARLGWKRTFRDQDGRAYAARYHSHTYADHFAACKSAGLRIEDVQEPRIDGKHPRQGVPVLLVVRAGKAE